MISLKENCHKDVTLTLQTQLQLLKLKCLYFPLTNIFRLQIKAGYQELGKELYCNFPERE